MGSCGVGRSPSDTLCTPVIRFIAMVLGGRLTRSGRNGFPPVFRAWWKSFSRLTTVVSTAHTTGTHFWSRLFRGFRPLLRTVAGPVSGFTTVEAYIGRLGLAAGSRCRLEQGVRVGQSCRVNRRDRGVSIGFRRCPRVLNATSRRPSTGRNLQKPGRRYRGS